MATPEWKIDVYGYRISDSTALVNEVLSKAGLPYEFHNMSSDGNVIKAVQAMSAIDGRTEAPRIYIRHGIWPDMKMKAVLFAPSRAGLQMMLKYHGVASEDGAVLHNEEAA